MIRGFTRRGQPLVALVLVLGGWVSARAVMWDAGDMPRLAMVPPPASKAPERAAPAAAASPRPRLSSVTGPAPFSPWAPYIAAAPLFERGQPGLDEPVSWAGSMVMPARANPAPRFTGLPRGVNPLLAPVPRAYAVPAEIAGGHRIMWLAALSNMPVAPGLIPAPRNAAPFPVAPAPRGQTGRRWSADAWMLWRRGSQQSLAAGGFAPSYGASQAGAVLRYRLAPDSTHRPAAFLRTTAALNGSNERDVALGLQARPFGRVPLLLAGEARFTSTPGGTMVRPAVFAVTELPPFALPLGLRGEAYAQGGYIGGKFATPFADGQLRVDRRLVQLGQAEMRLGGGVWGGAQKGAARLDAGPSVTVGGPLGASGSVRLGADWRFRVAGKAVPQSGPAVTLSAGF